MGNATEHKSAIRILLIDNFDSFTYNLVDEFEKRGCEVAVYRNSMPMAKINSVVRDFMPRLIVISPGPGAPKEAGISNRIIKEYAGVLPIFGVCLGLQCMVEAFGGKVGRAPETFHGKQSAVCHDCKTIYRGLPNPFNAGRYHSLSALKMPKSFEVSAKTAEGVVMGVRHRKFFVEGVQFHPESIMTTEGGKIISNLIQLVGGNGRAVK